MAKYRIFTVGFELPGDEFNYVEFDSNQTLLDADIILYEPTLGDCSYDNSSYQGKPVLTEHSSFATNEHISHWLSEIKAAVQAGKLVVVYLAEPEICFRYTGQRQYSGTGRSRVTTNYVDKISSYDAIPNLNSAKPKSGTGIRLVKDSSYLIPYWQEFSKYSPYEVEIDGTFTRILLMSRVGNRTVGAAVHAKAGGTLLFLPPLRYNPEKFTRYDRRKDETVWTAEGEKFGKRLLAALVALAETLKRATQTTPAPTWSMESQYRLAHERQLESEISSSTAQIGVLQARKSDFEAQLRDAGSLRGLLFEQGKPLEAAVLEALRLFGFQAKQIADADSEFDAVFVSPEGRCLGEAEGKDNKAISIDKLRQLEQNIQEDFARDAVTEYAKGVLFGNAYRLRPPAERGEFFTTKCVSGAQRSGIALVRTPDLFAPAKYLKETPSDLDYAEQCRKAIFQANGQVVEFPAPPVEETASIAETAETEENISANVDAVRNEYKE